MPKPTSSRPELITSRLVSVRASRTGEYHGAFRVEVPSRTREVTAAAAVSTVSGSRNVVYAAGIRPSALPG